MNCGVKLLHTPVLTYVFLIKKRVLYVLVRGAAATDNNSLLLTPWKVKNRNKRLFRLCG